MAKNVSVNLRNHPLSREEAGVVFEVKGGDGGMFGEPIVSKGGIRWRPKGNRDHHKINWTQLDKLAQDYPRR